MMMMSLFSPSIDYTVMRVVYFENGAFRIASSRFCFDALSSYPMGMMSI